FSSRRRHTRSYGDWSSDVCSSDLVDQADEKRPRHVQEGGRLLRRDFGFDGNERDGVTGGRFLENVEQQARHDRRQVEPRELMTRSEERRVGEEGHLWGVPPQSKRS